MKLKDDPRTALYIAFVLTFAAGVELSILHISITFLVAIYLCTQGYCKKALGYFIMYLLLFSASFFISTHSASAMGFFKNLQFLLIIIIRLFPLIMAIVVVKNFSPRKISAALSKMKVPRNIILAFLIVMRFLPTLHEEFIQILNAMHLRRLSFRSGYGFLHPFRTLRNILVPLLFRCLQISEELGYAAMFRGVDAPFHRSETETAVLRGFDYFLAAFFTATVISAFFINTALFEIKILY